MTEDEPEDGIACKLDAEERRRRAERLREELLPFLEAVRSLESGYALAFDGEGDALEAVTRHVRREAECCPFARYEIEIAPHAEEIEVRVTGEGVETMVSEGVGPLLDGVEGVTYTT